MILSLDVVAAQAIQQAYNQCHDRPDRSPLRAALWQYGRVFPLGDEAKFNQQWAWLNDAWDALQQFYADRQLGDAWIVPLWTVWLPLAGQLVDWRSANNAAPALIGLLGSQGSGKTTLTALLKILLDDQGLRVLPLSIDDFYLPYADRLALQVRDPRLIWRGPPGTHDVALLAPVLTQLRSGQANVLVPRFNKAAQNGAGDRQGFESVGAVDVVLLEGWLVGTRPVALSQLQQPLWPIVTPADQAFAVDMNQALYGYQSLWEQLDRLVVLPLADYRWSQPWRQQAEREMRHRGEAGMDDATVQQFVEYFWKALHPDRFIAPLKCDPAWADWIIEIGADHQPQRWGFPGAAWELR
jgi:D-glycerate 3-kinase